MSIVQTFQRRGKQQLFGEPKSARSRRTIVLAPVLVEELRRLREEQSERRRLLGPRYCDLGEHGTLVFCQPDGKPLHPANVVKRDFARVMQLAKVPRIRFHDLRHGFGSALLREGADLRLVSEMLGHSSPAFTLSTYIHTLAGQQAEAIHRLQARLFGENMAQEVEPTISNPA